MANNDTNGLAQLTANDFDFVTKSLSDNRHQPALSLAGLLSDPVALQAALDSDRVRKMILESPGTLGITPRLYFYVLVRRMLREFDREVADYIAGVLAAFVKIENTACPFGGELQTTGTALPVPYISDMLIALQSATTEREFHIRVYIGNCALFLSGVFPQYIHARAARRGAPAIGFYDAVGSMNYRLAANHRLAQANSQCEVYRTMAEHFTEVRVGLNQMADQLMCVETTP